MSAYLINKVTHCFIHVCISGTYAMNDNKNIVHDKNVLNSQKWLMM